MKKHQVAKLTFAVSMLMLLGVVTASAQRMERMQRMRMSPEDRAKVLADSLALDSTQTAQVVAIYKDQQDAMQKVREDNQGDFDAMRAAMTDLRTKTEEKIKAVLNDTQKAKYEEMLKNRPMGGMRGPRGGGGGY